MFYDIRLMRFNINKQEHEELWTMYGEYTLGTTLGLITALIILNEKIDIIFHIRVTNENGDQLEIYTTDDINKLFDVDFIHGPAIYKDLNHDIPDGKMGLWIYTYYDYIFNRQYWKLITVDDMSMFLQGYISIFQAFNVDFRDYIMDIPFDSNGIEYDLPEYDLNEFFEEFKEFIEFR